MPDSSETKAKQFLFVLRISIGGLIMAHGLARYWFGAVLPFGGWLTEQGLPMGVGIAVCITLFEVLGTPLLMLGRWVTALSVCYAFIYSVGLVMVHAPEGWFVVGLGRNGMEYSALLVICLLGLAWVHLPQAGDQAEPSD